MSMLYISLDQSRVPESVRLLYWINKIYYLFWQAYEYIFTLSNVLFIAMAPPSDRIMHYIVSKQINDLVFLVICENNEICVKKLSEAVDWKQLSQYRLVKLLCFCE